MKYDIEQFMTELEQFLKDNLNNKIAAVNAEKGDFSIDTISDDAYFLQTWNDKIANFNPVVFFGVDSVRSESNGPAVKKIYGVSVIIVFEDSGEDLNTPKKLYRYSRCLEEIFKENWDKMKNSVKIKIESMVPVSFQLVNSSNFHRAIGITLDFTLL